MTYTLQSDGGARGNPGPAGIGAVLFQDGKKIAEISEYIGKTTNNQAEYRALLAGLARAQKLGITEIHCFLDSKLVVEQMNRKWRVKDALLAKTFLKVWDFQKYFKKITFSHIPREKNHLADFLVNKALDEALKSK